ncbi:MAG: replicative DNA helicase [Actinomycetes bacterium]|jgi:replicative DNA helicase|nr:replicative DNA helicase [Actinomycetes bacterium]
MAEANTASFGGRIPPHNLDAERAVLGAMLLSTETQIRIIGILTSQDFFRGAHQTIFAAMEELVTENIKFDHLSLADKLSGKGQLAGVGGTEYLIELVGSVPTTTFAERYAEIVKKLSTYRQLIDAAAKVVSMAYEAPDAVEESVGKAEQYLFKVTEKQVSSDFRPLSGEVLDSAYDLLEQFAGAKGGIVGVETGFNDFDFLTRGLRGGQLVVLGARPAVGKTALALNMALGAARRDTTVGFFSLEMTAEDLALRMLTAEAGISAQDVRAGRVPDSYWNRFIDTSENLSRLRIYIDDTPDLNINRLRIKARRRFRNIEGKKLLIVDYLQLMSPDNRSIENRQQEIAQISRGLKILAKDLNIPILALSQLSRMAEMRKGKRPQLSDLRESGAIEQDADIVMFLHRPDMDKNAENDSYSTDDDDRRLPADGAELIVAKHRNGPTADILLTFKKKYAKFIGVSRIKQ